MADFKLINSIYYSPEMTVNEFYSRNHIHIKHINIKAHQVENIGVLSSRYVLKDAEPDEILEKELDYALKDCEYKKSFYGNKEYDEKRNECQFEHYKKWVIFEIYICESYSYGDTYLEAYLDVIDSKTQLNWVDISPQVIPKVHFSSCDTFKCYFNKNHYFIGRCSGFDHNSPSLEYNGYAEEHFEDGSYIQGDYIDGKFIFGKLVTKEKDEFNGKFVDGKPSEGIYTFAGGSIFEGVFENGLISKGIMTHPDGTKYEFHMLKGKKIVDKWLNETTDIKNVNKTQINNSPTTSHIKTGGKHSPNPTPTSIYSNQQLSVWSKLKYSGLTILLLLIGIIIPTIITGSLSASGFIGFILFLPVLGSPVFLIYTLVQIWKQKYSLTLLRIMVILNALIPAIFIVLLKITGFN